MRLPIAPPRRALACRAALACALLVPLMACGASPPAATGAVATVGTATAPSSAGVSSQEESAAGSASGTVPAGFPVMPGSLAIEPLPAEPGLLARWTTDANGAEVYSYFTEALPDAGFGVVQLVPGGAAAVIRFSAPDGRTLDVSLTGDPDGTRISLREPDPES